MIDNSCVILENGKKYDVIAKIKNQNFYFVYLSNQDDPMDFCCRKEIEEDEKTYLEGLENKEEAELALKLFYHQHHMEK